MRSFGQLLTWSIYSILTYTMIIIIYRTSSACDTGKLVHSVEVHYSVFIAIPYQIWSAKYRIKMDYFHQNIAYSIRFPDIIYSKVRNV